MKLLLFCVMQNDGSALEGSHLGLNGTRLQFVVEDDLMAVVSEVDRPEDLLTVEAASGYHGVIARLHQRRTVIPFRIGTLFERFSDVQELLRTRRERFVTMLRALDGCAEMGLRVLLDPESFEGAAAEDAHPLMRTRAHFENDCPGTAYLLSRKSQYTGDRILQEMTRRTVEQYASHFGSLSSRVAYERARECRHNGDPCVMISVYFLVPRGSVESFRDAFHALDDEMRSRTLLTGPWPPYNFVVAVEGQEAACTSPSRVCENPVSHVLRDLLKRSEKA